MDERASVRAYELAQEGREPAFCVSTRSSELTFVLEGELEVEVGPTRRVTTARAGEGVLVLRGTPHATKNKPGTRFVIIDLPTVPSAEMGVVALPSESIPRALERRIPDLWDQHEMVASGSLEQPLAQLVARAIPRGLVPLETRHTTALMLAVKRYLEAHYALPLDLALLASRFGVDRFYLVRAYTRNFGLSPIAYANALRIEHFVWSLLEDAAPGKLVELAGDAGFGDYSTFCRKIRDRFGRAPSDLVAHQS